MDKQLRNAVRSLLSDIDAMRCKPPYDVRNDGAIFDQEHWFGSFDNQGMNEVGDAIFQWPNLGIMAEKLQVLLVDAAMNEFHLTTGMAAKLAAPLD